MSSDTTRVPASAPVSSSAPLASAPRSAMAVAGLVLGIVALATSFVPIVNNASFFIALLSAAFAAVGIVAAVRGTRTGKGDGHRGARRERRRHRGGVCDAEPLRRRRRRGGRRPVGGACGDGRLAGGLDRGRLDRGRRGGCGIGCGFRRAGRILGRPCRRLRGRARGRPVRLGRRRPGGPGQLRRLHGDGRARHLHERWRRRGVVQHARLEGPGRPGRPAVHDLLRRRRGRARFGNPRTGRHRVGHAVL